VVPAEAGTFCEHDDNCGAPAVVCDLSDEAGHRCVEHAATEARS